MLVPVSTFAAVALLLAVAWPAIAQVTPGVEPTKLATDLNETVAQVPVTVPLHGGGKRSGNMIVTHFRPAGPGPFPLVVISHGRASDAAARAKPERQRFIRVVRYWVTHGFAVAVPTRLGYGATGVEPDTESSGQCDNRDYGPMSDGSAHQVRTALTFAAGLPRIDGQRIILMGQSVGGLATTVANGKGIPGVVAAINVAGGSGGNPKERPGKPCGADRLEGVYRAAGKTAKTPMLWLYAENDKYWGPQIPRTWHTAYTSAGAKADFVMVPPVGDDGHRMIDDLASWTPHVDRFIAALGLKKN